MGAGRKGRILSVLPRTARCLCERGLAELITVPANHSKAIDRPPHDKAIRCGRIATKGGVS